MARASRMASVHRSFEVIHKALTFEDALFAESGEAIAFVEALDSYRDFLETTIVHKRGCHCRERSFRQTPRRGLWESRAAVLDEFKSLKRDLESGHLTLLIDPASNDALGIEVEVEINNRGGESNGSENSRERLAGQRVPKSRLRSQRQSSEVHCRQDRVR